MKIFLTFVCLVLATQSYTQWDNWHNVPTTFSHPWTSNSSSTYTPPTLSGWIRNAVTAQSYFSDYSFRAAQYLHYLSADNTNLAFCGPRTYLHGNASLCQRDPFYWNTSSSSITGFCIPDVYGTSSSLPNGGYQQCFSWNGALKNSYPCCYIPEGQAGYSQIRDLNGVDSYTPPLF